MATTTYGTPYVSGTDLVANWPAASLTVANSIDAAGYYIGRGNNTQTGSYTTVLTDAGKIVTMSNASANTVTIPANASVAYVIGTQINILNLGAGACTPTAGAGVTISGTIAALTTNQSASLVKTATNTWSYLPGAVAATAGLTLISEQTFSAVAAVNFTSVLSATYRNYRLIFYSNDAGSTRVRLRAASTDNSAASYDGAGRVNGTAVSDVSDAGQTSWRGMDQANASMNTLIIDLLDPFIASPTGITLHGYQSTPATNLYAYNSNGLHRASTSFDGVSIILGGGGQFTGTAKLYGYQGA